MGRRYRSYRYSARTCEHRHDDGFYHKHDKQHAPALAGSYCLNRDSRPSRAFMRRLLLKKMVLLGPFNAGIKIADPANNHTDDPQP